MAAEADVVILTVGSDLTMASEGHDAVSLEYPGGQLGLIAQMAAQEASFSSQLSSLQSQLGSLQAACASGNG